MDLMRRQLEELMESVGGGLDGNGGSSSSNKHFSDTEVCKHYLSGLCPHDLFENTKFYLGVCGKVHSDELRETYMKARETRRYSYEEDTIRLLQQMIDDCDKKIARGMQRCEEDPETSKADGSAGSGEKETEEDRALTPVSAELKKLDEEIAEKMQKVEQLGEAGDVDASMDVMDKITELKKEREHIQAQAIAKFNSANPFHNQKLKPCNICGALLSVSDNDRRLSEHFTGKIHLGFQEIRKQLEELKENAKKDVKPAEDTTRKPSSERSREMLRRNLRDTNDRNFENDRGGRCRGGNGGYFRRSRSRHGSLERTNHRVKGERDRSSERWRDFEKSRDRIDRYRDDRARDRSMERSDRYREERCSRQKKLRSPDRQRESGRNRDRVRDTGRDRSRDRSTESRERNADRTRRCHSSDRRSSNNRRSSDLCHTDDLAERHET